MTRPAIRILELKMYWPSAHCLCSGHDVKELLSKRYVSLSVNSHLFRDLKSRSVQGLQKQFEICVIEHVDLLRAELQI